MSPATIFLTTLVCGVNLRDGKHGPSEPALALLRGSAVRQVRQERAGGRPAWSAPQYSRQIENNSSLGQRVTASTSRPFESAFREIWWPVVHDGRPPISWRLRDDERLDVEAPDKLPATFSFVVGLDVALIRVGSGSTLPVIPRGDSGGPSSWPPTSCSPWRPTTWSRSSGDSPTAPPRRICLDVWLRMVTSRSTIPSTRRSMSWRTASAASMRPSAEWPSSSSRGQALRRTNRIGSQDP
jgi:hypothetical protein